MQEQAVDSISFECCFDHSTITTDHNTRLALTDRSHSKHKALLVESYIYLDTVYGVHDVLLDCFGF